MRVLVTMRWFAIAAIMIASAVATFVFHIVFSFQSIIIVCIVIALYNIVLWRLTKRLPAEPSGFVIGRAKITFIQRFSGYDNAGSVDSLHGRIENPFLFLLILHVILAASGSHIRRHISLPLRHC